jgi:hypothetical protein
LILEKLEGALGTSVLAEASDGIAHERAQVEDLWIELEGPGANPRDVEQIVDEECEPLHLALGAFEQYPHAGARHLQICAPSVDESLPRPLP